MRTFYLPAFILAFFPLSLWAQPSNNECANAIVLSELNLWCSEVEAYTNVSATPSSQTLPSCFSAAQPNRDVWFTLTATAEILNVSVLGNLVFSEGGTIQLPQIAIYSGNCGSLTEIACETSDFGQNFVQAFAEGLQVGQTYFLRVSARNGLTGTFQLCVNNYNRIPQPSADCNTAVILCDKSPFTVDYFEGVGNDPNEIDDANCSRPTCDIAESNSIWYKWTCKDPGSLTFNITPLNPIDDIDFIVYELPNGIDNCSNKQEIRCMAAGAINGAPFSEWEPCTGPTGLSLTETDEVEYCGCDPGQNSYIEALQMVAGRSYALVINNFSESAAGFSIEFGGTGTFLGPDAAFTALPITACVGQPVTLTDASTFIGNIVGWQWQFGANASITSAGTEGPHSVTYNRPGTKSISLTVETDRGCLVTEIATIEVECCPDHFSVSADINPLLCPNTATGAIDVSVTNNFGPYTYLWSSGPNSQDINGINQGNYTITITDAATCDTVLTYNVPSPPPMEFDTLVTMPTCNGGTDGAVTLVVSGGSPPFQFNWQNTGFTNNNSLNNISQGDYAVVVRDANGCEENLLLPVRELELVLDPAVQAVTPPSCFGFSDGSIVVNIDNGLPPYQYDWNDGNGFVGDNSLSGITAGSYTVEVLDANLCRGFFEFDMQDYPPVTLDFIVINVSCNSLLDGSVTAVAGGGVGNYSYQWSSGQVTAGIDQLPAGNYAVTVLDGNGCEINGQATVTEPPPLFIDVVDVIDNICFGESEGSIEVAGSGGTAPFSYSIDDNNFQVEAIFANLPAGDYTLTVMDAMGCTAITEAAINQPPQLIVDAGPDVFIELGYDTRLNAVSNDPGVTYAWTPTDSLSCTDCPNLIANPSSTTTYLITVTDALGCQATDEVVVRVIKNRPIYIPNAISSNNDGINDAFTLYGGPAARRIKTLKVFSRWGSLVFDGRNLPMGEETYGWDGTFLGRPVNTGVFVFLAEVEFIDDEVVLYEGDITVVK
ncbi:MAG: gliding motility-associated C-terminal domain-containing protein [Saprospiraceae bacterium]|nr:gliding motility-associated C-terminal domain-containing protein [Saprospiraceae bacterium]